MRTVVWLSSRSSTPTGLPYRWYLGSIYSVIVTTCLPSSTLPAVAFALTTESDFFPAAPTGAAASARTTRATNRLAGMDDPPNGDEGTNRQDSGGRVAEARDQGLGESDEQ